MYCLKTINYTDKLNDPKTNVLLYIIFFLSTKLLLLLIFNNIDFYIT